MFKFWWDVFIIILAIFNCLSIPMTIAFSSDLFESPVFQAFDFAVDSLFFVDILINFNTTYYNKDGREIYNRCKIAKNYLIGRFAVDFLSTVPFDNIFTGVPLMKMFGVLKLVRITRLTIIINKLSIKEDIKALIKVGKLIFFLFLFLHTLACFWWFVVSIE